LGESRFDTLPRAVPLSPGEKLGTYEVLARRGAGGMGEVRKGHDSRLNRTVALKVSKAAFSERFEREARMIAALNHPHICTPYCAPKMMVLSRFHDPPITRGA
jgi:serine/threonine protein kinase